MFRLLPFIVAMLLASPALAQLGAPLPLGDLVRPPALNLSFAALPPLYRGHVALGPPLPLGNALPWTAGYIHARPAARSANPNGGPGAYPGFAWINQESAGYPNADEQDASGARTVTVSGGLLHLSAMAMPAAMLPDVPAGYPAGFVSGALTSYPYAQQFGVFEIRARLPKGQGLWPAFWLLPQDGTWPPEIDILEMLGRDPATIYVTSHSKDEPAQSTPVGVADTSAAFHLYTLDWGPSLTCWYFDRRAVRCSPTPADWHRPFYVLLNLALGGPADRWGGPPDATTGLPASMDVQRVTAWQRGAYTRALTGH